MARKALMLLPLCLLMMSNRGCETLDRPAAYAAAKASEAVAVAPPVLPSTLPDTCTAKMGRVYPTAAEIRVITQNRWLVLADNRDRKSTECGQWWAEFRSAVQSGVPR